MNQKCLDCKLIGNAFEYGHQRGSVIHGTHLSTVENNVYNDIRGPSIYIEDGNEMYNKISYNVAVCPWPFMSEKHGCTVPGKILLFDSINYTSFVNLNYSIKSKNYAELNIFIISEYS